MSRGLSIVPNLTLHLAVIRHPQNDDRHGRIGQSVVSFDTRWWDGIGLTSVRALVPNGTKAVFRVPVQ
jgi:hypothetical protein